jgi:hypothetical protein
MDKHTVSLILFSIGIAAILFSLFRTYYLLWKIKKERDSRGRSKPDFYPRDEDKNS